MIWLEYSLFQHYHLNHMPLSKLVYAQLSFLIIIRVKNFKNGYKYERKYQLFIKIILFINKFRWLIKKFLNWEKLLAWILFLIVIITKLFLQQFKLRLIYHFGFRRLRVRLLPYLQLLLLLMEDCILGVIYVNFWQYVT